MAKVVSIVNAKRTRNYGEHPCIDDEYILRVSFNNETVIKVRDIDPDITADQEAHSAETLAKVIELVAADDGMSPARMLANDWEMIDLDSDDWVIEILEKE